jgi:quinol monooxygenase YgiN
MSIRHVVTVRVAPGRAADFARVFEDLRAVTLKEEGCEEYELFQSVQDPDRLVVLERWKSHDLLEKHMAAERERNGPLIDALVETWATGVAPIVERLVT